MMSTTQNTLARQAFKCEDCQDTQELIHDSCDHLGEHVQSIMPCECTLKNRKRYENSNNDDDYSDADDGSDS